MAMWDSFVREGRQLIPEVGYSDVRNVLNANTTFTYQMATQMKNIIADAGNSNTEIVAARTDTNGKTYQTIGDRQDAESFKTADELLSKADKKEISSIQTQVNNLVLGAVGDGNNPEVVQARGAYTTLDGRTNDHDTNIALTRKGLFGDEKGALIKGYVNRDTGKVTVGDIGQDGYNWYHFMIPANKSKKISIDFPTPLKLRLVELNQSGAVASSKVISNGEFTLSDTTVNFAINIRLANSNPDSTELTAFNSIKDVYSLIVRRSEEGVIQKLSKTEQTLNENLLQIPVAIEGTTLTESQIDINILPGNHNGGYRTDSTGWSTFYVKKGLAKKIKVMHPVTANMRLEQYSDSDYTLAEPRSIISTNEEVQLREDCLYFAINFVSKQPSDPVIDWQVITPSEINLLGYFPESENRTLLEQFEELKIKISSENTSLHPIRILTIGNSFSDDADEFLYSIAKSAGVELVIGQLFIAAASLEEHWNNANNDLAVYTYHKWNHSGKITEESTSIKTAVMDENWDYVTFQQTSSHSGLYNSFQPYLNNLISYVGGIALNEDVEYGFHMTWAYATDSNHAGFTNYNNEQMEMYNAICEAYNQAMRETGITLLIPNGTSIQNARTNPYLNAIGDELTRDSYHLDLVVGRYVAGLTMFAVIIGRKYKKDLYSDVSFVPEMNNSNMHLAYLSKIAVENALKNPFKVTEI